MAVKNEKAKKTWGWLAIIALVLLALMIVYGGTGIGGGAGLIEIMGKTGYFITIALVVTLAIVAIVMNPEFLDILTDAVGKAGEGLAKFIQPILQTVGDTGANLLNKLAVPLIVGGLAFFTVSRLLPGGKDD